MTWTEIAQIGCIVLGAGVLTLKAAEYLVNRDRK